MDCFRDVLRELGNDELADHLLLGHTSSSLDHGEHPGSTAQSYSIAFQLLSMVEENAAVQQRRQAEREGTLADVSGLWQQNLKRLYDQGLSDREIAQTLEDVRVEPVLTAHPTEARRRTLLEEQRRIAARVRSSSDHCTSGTGFPWSSVVDGSRPT